MPKGIYKRKSNQERFWSYVDIQGFFDCWKWKGHTDKDGYGVFRFNGENIQAHRASYQLYYGTIPDGKQINHKCNNRPCCNPFHVYAGTNQDNMNDKVKAGRQAKGELHGKSKLTTKQVLEIRENKNNLTQIELGKLYDVSRSAIQNVIYCKIWKHILNS